MVHHIEEYDTDFPLFTFLFRGKHDDISLSGVNLQ